MTTLTLRQFVAVNRNPDAGAGHAEAERLLAMMTDGDKNRYLINEIESVFVSLTGDSRRNALNAAAEATAPAQELTSAGATSRPRQGISKATLMSKHWLDVIRNEMAQTADGRTVRIGELTLDDLQYNIDIRLEQASALTYRAGEFQVIRDTAIEQGVSTADEIRAVQ